MHSAQIRVRNGNVDALGGPLGDKFSGTKPTGPLFFTTRAPKLQKLPTHSPIFPGWGHTREMNLSMCTRGTGPPTGQNTEETANTNPDKTQIDPSKHLVRFVRRLGLECVDGGEAVKCHTKTRAILNNCAIPECWCRNVGLRDRHSSHSGFILCTSDTNKKNFSAPNKRPCRTASLFEPQKIENRKIAD